MNKITKLKNLYTPFNDCSLFPLGLLGRTSLVFGTGNPDADILFVGKVPGKNEDEQGVPFAGQSGKLITEMMLKSGTRREDVFITNIVKCRPPNNRAPLL